jgi:hypothetical protein
MKYPIEIVSTFLGHTFPESKDDHQIYVDGYYKMIPDL